MPAYLYVISRPTDGAMKVGQSTKPAVRLTGLNCEHRCRCTLEYSAACPPDQIDKAERHAHALLWADRVEGEWFAVELDAARAAVDAALAALGSGGAMLKPPPDKEMRLSMRVEPEFLRKLDALRKLEPDIPTRSEYIRRAVIRAVQA